MSRNVFTHPRDGGVFVVHTGDAARGDGTTFHFWPPIRDHAAKALPRVNGLTDGSRGPITNTRSGERSAHLMLRRGSMLILMHGAEGGGMERPRLREAEGLMETTTQTRRPGNGGSRCAHGGDIADQGDPRPATLQGNGSRFPRPEPGPLDQHFDLAHALI